MNDLAFNTIADLNVDSRRKKKANLKALQRIGVSL